MKLSSYQEKIKEWVQNGTGHAVVSAAAGSGKTTTAVMIGKEVSGSACFLAFNKSIAEEIGRRLEGTNMSASTVHSAGFACVRKHAGRVQVNARKYKKEFADRLTYCSRDEKDHAWNESQNIFRLLDIARSNLAVTEAEVADIAYHHDLDVSAMGIKTVCSLIEWGIENLQTIDFTDMISVPAYFEWTAPKKYSWVMIDECQDLSAAQFWIAKSLLARGGRMLAVGDPKQAINGFAGADAESFKRLVEFAHGTVLPLSICYRCPPSHLELVRSEALNTEIEAGPDHPGGTIEYVDWSTGDVQEGDLVVCRRNAPLFDKCLALITRGVPASIKGREFGAGLIRIVKSIGWGDNFALYLDAWERQERDAIYESAEDKTLVGEKIQRVTDKALCIRITLWRTSPKTLEELCKEIEALFDNERPGVVLSSIHRAKGLEASRVWVLEADALGHSKWATMPWQQEQERNLRYVALTRSKSALFLVAKEA